MVVIILSGLIETFIVSKSFAKCYVYAIILKFNVDSTIVTCMTQTLLEL